MYAHEGKEDVYLPFYFSFLSISVHSHGVHLDSKCTGIHINIKYLLLIIYALTHLLRLFNILPHFSAFCLPLLSTILCFFHSLVSCSLNKLTNFHLCSWSSQRPAFACIDQLSIWDCVFYKSLRSCASAKLTPTKPICVE